jgi:hypothetical protein
MTNGMKAMVTCVIPLGVAIGAVLGAQMRRPDLHRIGTNNGKAVDTSKEKELDLRIKELEISQKEYEQTHRPSAFKAGLTSPATIAAMIAAWATLTAALVTWQSGRISGQIAADSVKATTNAQFLTAQRKIETDLIAESVRTNNPDQAAAHLRFFLDTGLLADRRTVEKVENYLKNRKPGEGPQVK